MEKSQIDELLALRRLAGRLRACAGGPELSWITTRMVAAANDLEARALELDETRAAQCH